MWRNVIIMEEAAYIDESVFYEVVVPLMGVNNTAVLAISTPDDEDNYYSQLMEMTKEDCDEAIFKTIKIGLSCDDCASRKIKRCPHTAHRLPVWKSEHRQALTEHIMKGNEARMHRELHGRVGSRKQFVFKKHTSKMNKLAPYRWQRKPNVLHLGIDPSGGGASEYAYCLVGHEDGNDVIVAYYSIDTSDENDINSLFMALFKRLRISPIYSDCLVMVYVEAKTDHFIPNSLQRLFFSHLDIFGHVEFQMLKNKNKIEPGVLTLHDDKERYVDYVRHQMSNGHLLFAEQCWESKGDYRHREPNCSNSSTTIGRISKSHWTRDSFLKRSHTQANREGSEMISVWHFRSHCTTLRAKGTRRVC